MISVNWIPYILLCLVPGFFLVGYWLGKLNEKKNEASLFDLLIDRQNYTTEVLSEYYVALLEGKDVAEAEESVIERIQAWDSLHSMKKMAGKQ